MYKSSIILLLLFIGCKATEKSRVLPINEVIYNFDYKLQPNSTYLIKSLKENRVSSEIIGGLGTEMASQFESLFEGENHVLMGEHVRLITGALDDDRLPLSVSCDSVINKYDSPFLEEAMAMNNSLIQETIDASLRTTTFAHSVDQKNIEFDSIDFKSLKVQNPTDRNKYSPGLSKFSMGKNMAIAWAAQKKYPYGSMAIGDTFTHAELPYVYKPSKRDSIPKVKHKLSLEAQKRLDERQKMRDGLKNTTSDNKTDYILDRVEGDIAYFKISHKSATAGGLINSKGDGFGFLEYDLKEHCYRIVQTEIHQEMRTTIEEAVSVTKGKYLNTITIELLR